MRFHREQYLELMTFGRVERQMFVELMGPLVGLEGEWRAQGAAADEIDLTAFDWDYVPLAHCGGHTGPRGGLGEKVLADNDEFLLKTDYLGRTVKLCKAAATVPLPLDFPVKDMDDWRRFKPMYEFHRDRIDSGAVDAARKAQTEGALVLAHIPGAFNTPRELMGDEAACLAYYEQPELMRDILDTLRGTAMRVLEPISGRLLIDQLSVHEDLAGKSGPLIGPRQIEEFVKPYFRPVWEMLRSRGTRIFQMDTDGNVNPVIDAFLDCGLTSIIPMEPAAGMDVVRLRKKYGRRLAMQGGIDKHVLRRSKPEIRRELEYKMQPLMQQGGMVFGLDHRIPNGTPIENYRYYVDLGREILGLPPRDGKTKGWARMAF
ncbi:MAG TPA: uroporphyrinogen decarboxylase family protein [Phycisphaerae bacterium]|nr:uroporphyrinogen decarboxylase family protein [Phycisphaerae bacterium]